MLYKNFEIKPQDFEGEILYEVFALGKLQFAMVHKVNSSLDQKWQVTPETFSDQVDDEVVQEIGAHIESMDL